MEYEASTGETIPNADEQICNAFTKEDREATMVVQICEIDHVVLSVSKVVGTGSQLVFDDDNSFVDIKQNTNELALENIDDWFLKKKW